MKKLISLLALTLSTSVFATTYIEGGYIKLNKEGSKSILPIKSTDAISGYKFATKIGGKFNFIKLFGGTLNTGLGFELGNSLFLYEVDNGGEDGSNLPTPLANQQYIVEYQKSKVNYILAARPEASLLLNLELKPTPEFSIYAGAGAGIGYQVTFGSKYDSLVIPITVYAGTNIFGLDVRASLGIDKYFKKYDSKLTPLYKKAMNYNDALKNMDIKLEDVSSSNTNGNYKEGTVQYTFNLALGF